MSVPRPVKPPAKLAINSIECSPAVTRRNMQQLSTIPDGLATNQLYAGSIFSQDGDVIYQAGNLYADSIIINGSDATGMVKVNVTDALAFLEDQMTNHLAPAALPADFATMNTTTTGAAGAEQIAVIWDYTTIAGYNGAVIQYLSHDANGVLAWVTPEECA